MNKSAIFELTTDLLWNSKDPGKYAALVKGFERGECYSDRKSLRQQAFQYYPYVEDGEQFMGTREAGHLGRNIWDIEEGRRENSAKLGGINLFTLTEEGKYTLSEEGAILRDEYIGGSETEWKTQLLTMVLKYAPRVRCILYYMGVEGCRLHSSAGLFKGNEVLQKGDLIYPYYDTTDGCLRTVKGLVSDLQGEGFIDKESPLDYLYNIEYTMLSRGFAIDTTAAKTLLQIKHLLRAALTEVESIDDNKLVPQSVSETVTKKVREASDMLDQASIVEAKDEIEGEVEKPSDRFRYVPNLMVDANARAIVGPHCIEKAEEILDHDIETVKIRGVKNFEPASSQIVRVTRYGLRLLYDLKLVVETDDGGVVHNPQRAAKLLDGELFEELFSYDRVVDNEAEFLEVFRQACIEHSNPNGVVDWERVQETVTEEIGLSGSKFDREIETLISHGTIKLEPDSPGQPWQEGPPGMNAAFVNVRFT